MIFSTQTTVYYHFTTLNTYYNKISDLALSCLWLSKLNKIYGIIKLLLICHRTVKSLIFQ